MSGGHEAYVYYRVLPGAEHAAAVLIRGVLAEQMRRHPGLQARLLQRVSEGAAGAVQKGPTWMEIYTHVQGLSAGMLESIEAAMQQAGVVRYLEGPRQTEIFGPCA